MQQDHDIEDRIPIIVGVGQINDRPAVPAEGKDPVELIAAALRLAEEDAGVALLADADYLGLVRQIAFPAIADVAPGVAAAIGAAPAHAFQTAGPNGDSPIMLLNDAANRIGAGEVRIALVGGAEALRTAAARAAAADPGRKVDATRDAAHRKKTGYAQGHGLVAPVDVYPLYENALRAALDQSLAEAQQESGTIWSRFSEVAAANDGAWLRRAVSAEEVVTPGEANRPIAFPYTKLMVANAAVNQGAAFIVTSVGEARRRGIDPAKWIYVGNGAAAHEDENFLHRDRYDHSVSMAVSIEQALALNAVTPTDLDHVELYSCFPCIPKMARRLIDWPADRPASVFGGLTFGGGPIGNYMSHAVVSMVHRLRADAGTGLLFANGGYATHNHSIVIASAPIAAASFPRSFDFQEQADARRDPIPEIARDYAGPATLETYTIFFDRSGGVKHGVVVARTPDGRRTLAHVPAEDRAAISILLWSEGEPVGSAGEVLPPDGDAEDARALWRFT